MIHYDAIENRVLTVYFWWLLVSVPYYVAKLGVASQRAECPFLDTKRGKVFGYSVAVLAVLAITFLVGESPQNRAGVFAIILAPAILGVYSGFSTEKILPIAKENYVTAAQRKLNAFGDAIANK